MPRNPKTRQRPRPGRLSQARTMAIFVLLALSVRAFVAEAYVIPSGSMMPTLEVGDRIVVDRHVYGLKLPFVAHKLTHGRSPRRGEVVVLMNPAGEGSDLVKRVVAVGGDVVAMEQNRLLVNGRAVERTQLPGSCSYLDVEQGKQQQARLRHCRAHIEQLDGKRYRVFQHTLDAPASFSPRRVPPGHVFLLGDNRDNSHDSRYWGTVPHSHLKGRAFAVAWSFSSLDGVRWERWFSGIDRASLLASPLQ